MRIARVANMNSEIPPETYGGTPRVMALMTAFQAIRGDDIRLYAPEGSRIIPFTAAVVERMGGTSATSDDQTHITVTMPDGATGSVWLRTTGKPAVGYGAVVGKAARNTELFQLLIQDEQQMPSDIIHAHRNIAVPMLAAAGLMGRTVVQEHSPTLGNLGEYRRYHYPVIAISEDQSATLLRDFRADVIGVAYHGIDPTLYPKQTGETAGYMASIGRIAEFKGQSRGIAVARELDKTFIFAGKPVHADQQPYMDEKITPEIDLTDTTFLDRMQGKSSTEVREELERLKALHAPEKRGFVLYVGEATDEQKKVLFSNAEVGLFPISWAEPFGIVPLEFLSSGTPVAAYAEFEGMDTGAVKEIIIPGVNGVLIYAQNEEDGIAKMAECVERDIPRIDRCGVVTNFRECWSAEREAERLDEIYNRLLERGQKAWPDVCCGETGWERG